MSEPRNVKKFTYSEYLYRLTEAGEYELADVYTKEQEVDTPLFPDLKMALADIFRE